MQGGGIEEATLYYQKAIELAKKAGNNEMLSDGLLRVPRGRGEVKLREFVVCVNFRNYKYTIGTN